MTATRAAHAADRTGKSRGTGQPPGATDAPPALRLVIRPAPRREPPFDDEIEHPSPVGALDQVLPFAMPRRPPHRIVFAPHTRRGLPEPGSWTRRLLLGLVETADGRRPLHQLSAMLSPSVNNGIAADFERAALAGRPHWLHRAAVRTVRSSEPADGVAELCATVQVGERTRAIALRVEERHGRWRCTRLQLG